MPSFSYRAMTVEGQDVSGVVEATDRAEALRELVTRGTCVTELAERDERSLLGFSRREGCGQIRIRSKQVAVLTRQLATSLEAGLPLMSALHVVGSEIDHSPTRTLLCRLGQRVQEGASFSDALAEHPKVFSPMYVRLARVGETGGMLDVVLGQLADMLERAADLRERVKTASIYPAILTVVGLASIVVIVTFIVPRILESLGTDAVSLPLTTRMLMAISDFVGAYWWLLLGGAAAVSAGFRQIVLRGPGRPGWDALKLRMPILGRLIRQTEAARFARSLGILTKAGVSITTAMAVVLDTLQNTVIRNAVSELARSIQGGESIAMPLQRSGLFPPLLVQMVRVGENTGRLDEMLLRSANVHESEAKVTLDRLVGVLPVLLILVLACVIGFIAGGLILAIVEFQSMGVGGMPGR
ncbi:MAG TPA: type II secretion system F family protein [Phycisphaerae bacterium]|nr:type II secretion system F family protein [Phycisphaerae bacterium]HRY69671.1 type II secretion system F family protein [Phycisphaerae bacterium]HSA25132.1 type II secretion system F family protein [Phycisphaerae bacterium]